MKTIIDLQQLTSNDPVAVKKLIEELIAEGIVTPSNEKKKSPRMDRVLIGKVLKKIRKDNGLSQQEICERLGLNNSNFVSNIENGKSVPPKNKLFKFSIAYEADVLLNFALLKYAWPDDWAVWLEGQAILAEMFDGPDPFLMEQKIVEWVSSQIGRIKPPDL